MNFLKTVKSSIYDPEFYSGLIKNQTDHPFRYYFKLALFVALIYAVLFSVVAIKDAREFFGSIESAVAENYPRELEVKLEKGIVTTNVTEPYFVKIPASAEEKMDQKEGEDFENLVVIDTKGDFSLEKFENYKTFALLTKDGLVAKDNGKVTIFPLKDVPDYTLNYENITQFLSKVKPFLNVLPYLIPVFAFVAVFIVRLFMLLYVFLAALVVMIVGKLKGIDLSYRKSYDLSLHLVTLQILVSSVLFLAKVNQPMFFPTLILAIVAWVNLRKDTPEVLVTN